MRPSHVIKVTNLLGRESMSAPKLRGLRGCATLCFVLVAICTPVAAETVKIEGFITGNNGDQITVKFGSGAELTFMLTEDTEVSPSGSCRILSMGAASS